MSGQKLPLKMSVDYISFSAHTDYQQTSEFIRALKPPHVVSVGVWCSASRGGGADLLCGSCFSAQTLPSVHLPSPAGLGELRAAVLYLHGAARHYSFWSFPLPPQ